MPLLTLVFGVDIRYAIGASLVSVIATSSGAAAAYVREGYWNIRIGMFLEIATTIGALVGAFLAGILAASLIAVIFGLVLFYSAYLAAVPKQESIGDGNPIGSLLSCDWMAVIRLRRDGKTMHARGIPGGFSLMFVAGSAVRILGIGSGAVKVIAMDQLMRLPFKVSTTTSNFMIGVTAAASAGVYLSRGYIEPGLVMPVLLGVLAGSLLGARVLITAPTKNLRIVFSSVIVILGVEMILNGIPGNL